MRLLEIITAGATATVSSSRVQSVQARIVSVLTGSRSTAKERRKVSANRHATVISSASVIGRLTTITTIVSRLTGIATPVIRATATTATVKVKSTSSVHSVSSPSRVFERNISYFTICF